MYGLGSRPHPAMHAPARVFVQPKVEAALRGDMWREPRCPASAGR